MKATHLEPHSQEEMDGFKETQLTLTTGLVQLQT